MTINAVSVVEFVSGSLVSIRTFADDESGNKSADALFTQLCFENGADQNDIESYIENGSFENGSYYVALAHST